MQIEIEREPGRPGEQEWLETDGEGGYSLGLLSGIRTRKYHSWYCYSDDPPVGRRAGCKHIEVVASIDGRQCYRSPSVFLHEKQKLFAIPVVSFTAKPWPTWKIELEEGIFLIQEHLLFYGKGSGMLRWSLENFNSYKKPVDLEVRPFLSESDHHHLSSRDTDWKPLVSEFVLGATVAGFVYPLSIETDGLITSSPVWYEDFHYRFEEFRGYDHSESLWSPGLIKFSLSGESAATMILQNKSPDKVMLSNLEKALEAERLRREDRVQFRSSQFIVAARDRSSIIAGYPWFTDWGRDTFISLRGLCLETGRLQEARDILCGWAHHIDRGMIPNRFPDESGAEYNSVDASLWYIISAHAFLDVVKDQVRTTIRKLIEEAVNAIIEGYIKGTRYQIGCDDDGLIYAGEETFALTWMDARYKKVAITPRIGKPVEIQALWLNALALTSKWNPDLEPLFKRGLESFRREFIKEDSGYLYDVIDVNGSGEKDPSFRPNQLFAAGGLPFSLLPLEFGAKLLKLVDEQLLTSYGLRTLSIQDPRFCNTYQGNLKTRDSSYHQGTVWPWLIGPYIDVGLKTGRSRKELITRLSPLLDVFRNYEAGLSPEIYDGEVPITPRGCPYQAWTLAECIRTAHLLGIEV